MFRNSTVGNPVSKASRVRVWNPVLLALALLTMVGMAFARPLSIVIVPGDPATPAALAAIKQLQREEQLKQVSFHILPTTSLGEKPLAILAASDAALVHNMGRELSLAITPAVKQMSARGAKAFAVGSPFEEGERQAGLTRDESLRAYAQAGGAENIVLMIKRLLSRDFGFSFANEAPRAYPDSAIWDPRSGKTWERFDQFSSDYLARRPEARERVWIGLLFNRVSAQSGASPMLVSIVDALERRGFNVLPVFGYPSEVGVRKFLLDGEGKSRVAAVVALALKMGNVASRTIPVMKQLDVPVINAISLYNQTQKEWEDSAVGLSLMERSWQISGAEFAGAIAPTVVAAKETRRDPETGLNYVAEVPIAERIERLADRVARYVTLRYEVNANKRVAVIYYNYPPGKENIGAAYLNVMPRSLWQILNRLDQEGYATAGRPASESALFDRLHEHGVNIGTLAPGALEKLVRGGNAMLLPVAEYRRWFNQQPEKLRTEMIRAWGEPEKSNVMVWRDARGKPNFVFPAQKFGNLVFAPQPSRGWEGDVRKMYHDVGLPPHHQYLAFYLWLQKGFKAHAMVHVGTHATHEWLSGKEVGFTAADPGEAMVADVPQLYPYIVDDIGEALQAKRRGMATVISHLTPPLDKASLNKELRLLKELVDDYVVAAQKSESAAAAKLGDINAQAAKVGVLKDLGKTKLDDAEAVEVLEHYLKEILEHDAPYGLHTFGVSPSAALQATTADAILGMAGKMTPADYAKRKSRLIELLAQSGQDELNALIAGLAGRHVVAGPGNDPVRNPEALPTGRNLYGFDPTRLPTVGTFEQGRDLAEKFVADYKERHGNYPDRLVFNLWSTEAMRHEGVTEAEILALMGVQPEWDERGKVVGLTVISRRQLGRPRVDVTIIPSGLYRDALPTLMQLLDDAVSKVKDLDENDNAIRANVLRTQQALEARGIAPADAARMAAVRLFSEPTGAYGTGVDNAVQASNTWQNEGEIADVYFNRVGHLFGQGYWGERPGGKELAVDIFRMALKDARAVIHSRSSTLFATLDNDDVFQYLGATAMAIRQVDGTTPETFILNLADPKNGKHETLDRFMGREMRTRYTNPEWIKGMMKEGYSGARFVMKVHEHLWGWQVTVPEAVDGAKWQEMYETYVKDRNELGIKQMFRDARNMLAYQAIVDKMLVAVNKGYWKADPRVKAHLDQVNRELIAEAGVACNENSCSSREVTELARAEDRKAMAEALAMPAPDLGRQSALSPANAALVRTPETLTAPVADAGSVSSPAPAPDSRSAAKAPSSATANSQVEGFEVKEQNTLYGALSPEVRHWALAGFVALVLSGFALRSRKRRLRRGCQ